MIVYVLCKSVNTAKTYCPWWTQYIKVAAGWLMTNSAVEHAHFSSQEEPLKEFFRHSFRYELKDSASEDDIDFYASKLVKMLESNCMQKAIKIAKPIRDSFFVVTSRPTQVKLKRKRKKEFIIENIAQAN